jgi:PHD/YefM family antitoxin component YafN of YafNO toxin-antitoxin module
MTKRSPTKRKTARASARVRRASVRVPKTSAAAATGVRPISATAARSSLSEMVNKAAFAKERFVLTRQGKAVAALISAQDLALLERLEDEMDIRDADRAQAGDNESGEPNVSWEALKAQLGL